MRDTHWRERTTRHRPEIPLTAANWKKITMSLTPQRLEDILAKIRATKIGILGDFCLDRYFDIDPTIEEISLETDRPCHQVFQVRCFPGGAGTVTSNLYALGVRHLYAIGPIGEDGEAFTLRKKLEEMSVDQSHLVSHPDRLTPSYNKPMKVQQDRSLEEQDRLDIRSRGPLIPDLEDKLVAALEEVFPDLDGLIVLDQFEERNEHAVTDRVREKVAELSRKHPDKIVFSDSRARIGEFRDTLIKPNEHEAARALGLSEAHKDLGETKRGGLALGQAAGRSAFVTLGEKGLMVCDPATGAATHVPGYEVPPPLDICGAGDSTTAGIVSALCAGASQVEAGTLGCLVASITVQQIGVTGTASPDQVRERFAAYRTRGLEPKEI
jgi:rfaE bifunctional protein kinase chain/domain